jgi:hypothetical protein
MGGSRFGSRLYLIEQRTGKIGQEETWAAHSTYTAIAKATKKARALAEEGGSFRVAEFVFNRVAVTIYDYRSRYPGRKK